MDGSIGGNWDADELYFALMHPFFCTAQKLSLSGELLQAESQPDGSRELRLLAGLLLKAVQA